MNESHITYRSDEDKDSKSILTFEGNYVLDLLGKIKWINKKNPLQVSILLFFIGWIVPCILACFDKALFFTDNVEYAKRCFLFDLTMYAFYVFPLPILFYFEYRVSAIMNHIVRYASRSNVLSITPDSLQRSIDRTNNLSLSKGLHSTALCFAYASSLFWIYLLLNDGMVSWHGMKEVSSELQLPTLSGIYVSIVSIPIGLYFIFTWAMKAGLWYWLVKDMTRSRIRVNPIHPDKCGGLFFFSRASQIWGWLILVVGLVISLDYINFVYLQDAKYTRLDLVLKLIAFIVIAPILFIGQMLFFRRHLAIAKWHYIDKVGTTYVDVQNKLPIKIINRKLFPSVSDSNKLSMVAVESAFGKVKSMRLWLFDMSTLTNYLVPVVTALITAVITAIIKLL